MSHYSAALFNSLISSHLSFQQMPADANTQVFLGDRQVPKRRGYFQSRRNFSAVKTQCEGVSRALNG